MKLIHVNKQHISMNSKDGKNRPIYSVKEGKKIRYAREVEILGPSKLVYDGSSLSCGAKAWLETDSEVKLIDENDI